VIKQLLRSSLIAVTVWLAACTPDLGNDQHGQPINESRLRGHWLVINYWAEWCGPCHKEIPELNALARVDASIHVLGVNYDHLPQESLRKSVEKMGIQYTVFQADPAQHFSLPSSDVLPATYLVDPSGKYRDKLVGEQTASAIKERIASLERAAP
jgi:thiol-disulfide isomerase/thioredoxin